MNGIFFKMPFKLIQIENDVVTICFQGMLRLEDMKIIQEKALELIEAGKKIKLLAILDNFEGWDKADDWGDVGFLVEHGDAIIKMAFVGDVAWQDDIYIFVGKGLRATEMEFFSPTALDEAKDWLRQ